MSLPDINKRCRGHGPKSHRLHERRHLKFHICLLLYSPHIPSWSTLNSSKRLLLLVVTTIPMNRPTGQIEWNRKVTAMRSVIIRGKPRKGWIRGNVFPAFSAEAVCINRASLSSRYVISWTARLLSILRGPEIDSITECADDYVRQPIPRLMGTAGTKQ